MNLKQPVSRKVHKLPGFLIPYSQSKRWPINNKSDRVVSQTIGKNQLSMLLEEHGRPDMLKIKSRGIIEICISGEKWKTQNWYNNLMKSSQIILTKTIEIIDCNSPLSRDLISVLTQIQYILEVCSLWWYYCELSEEMQDMQRIQQQCFGQPSPSPGLIFLMHTSFLWIKSHPESKEWMFIKVLFSNFLRLC